MFLIFKEVKTYLLRFAGYVTIMTSASMKKTVQLQYVFVKSKFYK